jgi:arylsulfatase A-like enzyme/Flp pilus assembly protein TadD
VIDQLAKEGVRFERAFTAVPLTLPAHASIMTGVYPSFHGVRDNSGFVLPAEQTTLAEVLKESGYATGAVVGAFVLDSKFGLNQGFDSYYDHFDLSRFENVSPGYIQRTADLVVKEAVRWLESKGSEPFFLWMHLYDPHDPYTPPEPYAGHHPGRPYDGEIEFADTAVGSVIGWLKNKGEYDNTLISVIGDHGESLGEHGESKHGFFIYDATLHVPWILRFPGGQNAGKTVKENVSTVDLFPTVLQYLSADRAPLSRIQGSGRLAAVMGKSSDSRSELYAECYYPRLQFGWSELRALISGPYKFILAPKPELYNLTSDFDEHKNIAPENQAMAQRLSASLQALIKRSTAAFNNAQSRLDPATLEKLRSLGYVSVSMGKTTSEDFATLADPKDRIAVYNELTDLFEAGSRGDYENVIPRYREVLRREPGLKLVHYKLGQALFHTARYSDALEEFKKAIQLGGDEALATFDLAQTYLKLKRTEEAILGFERTVQLDPAHYRARTNLGVLYKNAGRIQDAIRQFEKALESAPGSVNALGNLGVAYSIAGQQEKAITTLKRAIEFAPQNPLLHVNLGVVFQRAGMQTEAEEQFAIARRLNPNILKR